VNRQPQVAKVKKTASERDIYLISNYKCIQICFSCEYPPKMKVWRDCSLWSALVHLLVVGYCICWY